MATEVSASELLTESPSPAPSSAPIKQKLYAEDFPGLTIEPAFPNATYGRHPITKQFVSLRPKPNSIPPVETPKPPPPPPPPEAVESEPGLKFQPTPEMPLNFGQLPPLPEPAAPAAPPPPETPPTAPEPEPASPDFSDLPGANAAPEIETAPVMSVADYEAQAELYFDFVTAQLAVIIGPEWNAASMDERESVTKPIARYLHSIGAKELSPRTAALAAVLFYSARRVPHPNTKEKLFGFWLKLKTFFARVFRRA